MQAALGVPRAADDFCYMWRSGLRDRNLPCEGVPMKGSIFGANEKRSVVTPKEWVFLVTAILVLIIVTAVREHHHPGSSDIINLLGLATAVALIAFLLVAAIHF